jgi:hypothetical protein
LLLVFFSLQGCDTQETKVKKLLKCGLAVDELGNEHAQDNYKKNSMLFFGTTPPALSHNEMVKIGDKAREELWMDSRNSRGTVQKLLEVYGENIALSCIRNRTIRISKC